MSVSRSTRRGKSFSIDLAKKYVYSREVQAFIVPPTDSMAREMSTALRRGVPLNSMCSMKCATPLSAGVSAREPTGTQIPTVADRSQGTCSVTMATPLSRRVRATVIAAGRLPRRTETQHECSVSQIT